jgi:hypothetical protein
MKKKSKRRLAMERDIRPRFIKKKGIVVDDLFALERYVVKYLAYKCQRCFDGAIKFYKNINNSTLRQLPCPNCRKIQR